MPATELNKFPAESTYDMAKQKAMFKLWLILTTDQFTVGDGVKIFDRTKDAEAFKSASRGTKGRIFYIDLEKIAVQLKPLHSRDVKRIFKTMMRDNREFLQTGANLFRQYAQDPCEYGPAGCITVQEPLDICLPVPKQAELKFLAAKKRASSKLAAGKS